MATRSFKKRNGRGPKRAKAGQKKDQPVKNINGVTCGNQFLAYISSIAFANHWTAECNCTARKLNCKAAKKYGETRATWGSKDEVVLPARVMPPKK